MVEKEQYTLLIPKVLDAHLPLLKYAFYRSSYIPVIMEETDGILKIGKQYIQSDICYPAILIAGQMIKTLQSGEYNTKHTAVLVPDFLKGCLNEAYIPIIRKALDEAGFSDVLVLSLSGEENRLPITTDMFLRAVAALFYGDLLMLLVNQTEPYEKYEGLTGMLASYWTQILSEDLREAEYLSERYIVSRFREIVQDFNSMEKTGHRVLKVGIVGELYVKYCRMGNRDLEHYLKGQSCEYYINGLTWYVLFYIENYLLSSETAINDSYSALFRHLLKLQKEMVKILWQYGFYCMDAYDVFKKRAEEYVRCRCGAGDGWLIGAEFAQLAKSGYDRILCGQPLKCLVSPVCGRGLYPSIKRKFPEVKYVSMDYDANYDADGMKRQIQMLLTGCQ